MRQQVEVTAEIAAPVEKVWAYWTQPEHITQWNFADDDWCCPSAEADLREGGTYKARMEAKDGSFGFDFAATYDEVKPNEVLSLTMHDGRQARTTFSQDGDMTKVSTIFDAEEENPVDMQKDGWQAILNNFKAYAESKADIRL